MSNIIIPTWHEDIYNSYIYTTQKCVGFVYLAPDKTYISYYLIDEKDKTNDKSWFACFGIPTKDEARQIVIDKLIGLGCIYPNKLQQILL